MSRSTDEWHGKTDDTPVPPRVRVRQFERDGGRCQCGCKTLIRPGDKWETDHKVAIINGGENIESNLRTMLALHHKAKSQDDLKEKSVNYRIHAKHIGAFAPRQKIVSAGFRKAAPQRSASRPIKRSFQSNTERSSTPSSQDRAK